VPAPRSLATRLPLRGHRLSCARRVAGCGDRVDLHELLENVECELLLGCQRIRVKRNADEQKGKEQPHEHCSPSQRVVPPELA